MTGTACAVIAPAVTRESCPPDGAQLLPPNVHEHLDLVRRIAYSVVRRLPSHVDVRDLVQAGYVGLLDAAENFAVTRNASFRTYAGIRIRGAIIDFLRRGSPGPRPTSRWLREIAAATWRIERQAGRPAQAAEIAAQLGMSLEQYHRTLFETELVRHESLDAAGTGGCSASDTLADEGADIVQAVEREQLLRALADAIDRLPERERTVILLYFGEDRCLREIAAEFEVSDSRISQIRKVAVDRLRAMVQEWVDAELPALCRSPDPLSGTIAEVAAVPDPDTSPGPAQLRACRTPIASRDFPQG